MAPKPNAGTSRILEQTIEDLPSGLTLHVRGPCGRHAPGDRRAEPARRIREILFDAEGRLIATGPVLKKVHM